jgi:hypothetical protein
MRLIVFLLSLLCGCSSPMVRCDAHLKPINPPAAGPAAAAATAASAATAATAASAAGGGVTEVSGTADSEGGTPPSRRAP